MVEVDTARERVEQHGVDDAVAVARERGGDGRFLRGDDATYPFGEQRRECRVIAAAQPGRVDRAYRFDDRLRRLEGATGAAGADGADGGAPPPEPGPSP